MTEVDVVDLQLLDFLLQVLQCYSARVAAANDSGAAGANDAAGVVGRLGCCTLALLAAAVEWVLI